jgi:hypothetical protein
MKKHRSAQGSRSSAKLYAHRWPLVEVLADNCPIDRGWNCPELTSISGCAARGIIPKK